MNIKISEVESVEKLSDFNEEYVYDIEMDDENHVFFANDILVHNSTYLNIESMVKTILGDKLKWSKQNIHKVLKIVDEFVEKVNENCGVLAKKLFNSDVDSIKFKRETFCTEAAFLVKKRYVLHIAEKEGKMVDDFKYVGVDVKKNELPVKIKGFLKEVIESSMRNGDEWTNSKYKECMLATWEKFKLMTPTEIAFIKNYTTAKESIGFMSAEKGAGAHARAVIYYNQLIEELHLQKKYDIIRESERFQYLYIKPNNYCINVIGFKDEWPSEFNDIFIIDRETMFSKVVFSPLKRFAELNKWHEIDLVNQAYVDIREMFG